MCLRRRKCSASEKKESSRIHEEWVKIGPFGLNNNKEDKK